MGKSIADFCEIRNASLALSLSPTSTYGTVPAGQNFRLLWRIRRGRDHGPCQVPQGEDIRRNPWRSPGGGNQNKASKSFFDALQSRSLSESAAGEQFFPIYSPSRIFHFCACSAKACQATVSLGESEKELCQNSRLEVSVRLREVLKGCGWGGLL